MRQQRNPDEQSGGYNFFFQIANGGERRACCVKVDAPSMQEASVLFRDKWPIIEEMARDGVKGGVVEQGIIRLVMP